VGAVWVSLLLHNATVAHRAVAHKCLYEVGRGSAAPATTERGARLALSAMNVNGGTVLALVEKRHVITARIDEPLWDDPPRDRPRYRRRLEVILAALLVCGASLLALFLSRSNGSSVSGLGITCATGSPAQAVIDYSADARGGSQPDVALQKFLLEHKGQHNRLPVGPSGWALTESSPVGSATWTHRHGNRADAIVTMDQRNGWVVVGYVSCSG